MSVLIDVSHRSVLILVATVLACGLTFSFQTWQRYVSIRNAKRRHGCEDPPKYPHEDRMGSDMVRIRAKASKEGRFFKLYDEMFAKFGRTYEETWRGKPLINTRDPANAQYVAALAVQDFSKDPERYGAVTPLLGPSIMSDGPTWKPARALIKPIFARGELSDLDHMETFATRFLDLIPNDGAEVDLQPLLRRLSLDVSMGFIFGKSLGFLNTEVPAEASEFIEAFYTAMRWTIRRREAGWLQFRIYRWFPGKEYKDAYSRVHQYIDQQVARALAETKKVKSPEPSSTGRKRYILLDEMAKEIRDPIQLRYHVIAPFLPGRESVGISVGNMIFQLARHPHWWTKLRQTALALGDAPLTFEKLKSLVDFKYVYQETIRLIGPSARIWRKAVRDTILPSGGGQDGKSPVFLAKGTPVVVVTRAMGHDKQTWGEDVDDFRPERCESWTHEFCTCCSIPALRVFAQCIVHRTLKRTCGCPCAKQADMTSGQGIRPMWDFVPFWGGPRICPAQQQVYTYSIYMLVKLTQRFESIENCDPVFEFVEKTTSSVESMNGIKVALKLPPKSG